jgi:hypothetical protein
MGMLGAAYPAPSYKAVVRLHNGLGLLQIVRPLQAGLQIVFAQALGFVA